MKKVITFGEVMMRLSTPDFQRFQQAKQFNVVFGGSEANVTASLAQFDIPSGHVTVFPDNDLGKSAANSLHFYGVDISHIQYKDGRLGTYYLENGAMFRSPRIIYDRFHSAFSTIQAQDINWDLVMKDAGWFHWTGITPAISQGAADACLEAIKAAKRVGATISGDINYRRNLWQYGKTALEIMPELISHCDIIVGGTTDFHNCLGIDEEDYLKACNKVALAYPSVKKIAKTIRETFSASHNSLQGVIWTEGKLVESKILELTHMVDRVGAGDAFMAGLIYGWITDRDNQYTVDYATAASAFKHTVEGDVNQATVAEIEQIMKGENLGKLLR